MIILAIETSCDETALALIEAKGELENPEFKILGTSLFSQIKIHEQYGGVFPMLAKREHAKNLVPLLKKLWEETELPKGEKIEWNEETKQEIEKILDREKELLEDFLKHIVQDERPKIDAIAVTEGPGLEPALWVGINFAKALSHLWNVPVIPVNHMAGHIYSVLAHDKINPNGTSQETSLKFPALALLISGGHTELVLINNWEEYKVIGATRDDAVGEAFDKVARLLGLPYPGGPQISKLAESFRASFPNARSSESFPLPRPMIDSNDYDFSFAGLKTAVLYTTKKIPDLTEDIKKQIACEFENAATEVLVFKTKKAIEEFLPKTLIIGGGVVANNHIRAEFSKMVKEFPELSFFIPETNMATDNAVMISIAGYIKYFSNKKEAESSLSLRAKGNLSL